MWAAHSQNHTLKLLTEKAGPIDEVRSMKGQQDMMMLQAEYQQQGTNLQGVVGASSSIPETPF